MNVRHAEASALAGLMALATETLGPGRAGPLVRSHAERHHLLVAEEAGDVVGVLGYRTDWFQCTLVGLVCVRDDRRRRGIARALFKMLEAAPPRPRLYPPPQHANPPALPTPAPPPF